MIVFNKEIDLDLRNEKELMSWISKLVAIEGFKCGEINYIFVSDDELLELNIKHLNHNTLTDVISFDYTSGRLVSGDIYISVERVIENAQIFRNSFYNELYRVMAHGVLHYCGYKDKDDDDKRTMRSKENFYLDLINF